MAPDSRSPYPIGQPGSPWSAAHKATWLGRQRVQRSYADEVLAPLRAQLPAQAELFQYGLLDPNRQFRPNSPAAESALAMACVSANCERVDVHVDLHETTDTDNSEFGPAKAARDGVPFDRDPIPDGFYLVADSERPVPQFQRALIDAVRRVTYIAAADERGLIIGVPLQQEGVIQFAQGSRGLCGAMTGARFVTTTEVYPDSPSASPTQCNEAQIAALNAAIEYVLNVGPAFVNAAR